MIGLTDYQKGLEAWSNIKKQAVIDMEQANHMIPFLEKKIEELKNSSENKNGE